MRHRSFGDFVDKKKRESIRQLKLVKSMLESTGMKVENYLDLDDEDHEPYIFCYNPTKSNSFDGIRIYKIGSDLAFRIQKESKTHPYGSAYPLPIETMFYDFLSDDDVDEKKAGKKIIESIGKEIRKFFAKSSEADKNERDKNIDDNSGDIIVKSTGTDYSSMIYSKG